MLSDVTLVLLYEALRLDSANEPSSIWSERIEVSAGQALRHFETFAGPVGTESSWRHIFQAGWEILEANIVFLDNNTMTNV